MGITRVAIDRPVATIMAVLVVVVISVVSLTQLPIDLMPEYTYPAITILVTYPGSSPEELETLVARPIEEAMGSIEHMDELETNCYEENASIRLRFAWGTELDEVAAEVRQRLDRLRRRLPDDIDPPTVNKYDFSLRPIMRLGLFGPMDSRDLRHLAEYSIKRRLERVPGVASVSVSGGRLREIQVDLSQKKMDALDISPQTVVGKIRAENINLPAGEVNEGRTHLLIRTRGQFGAPEELERIVIATRDGVPIYLRDIADIVDGFEEVRRTERVNGRPAISLSIYKQPGNNTVVVSEAVQKELALIGRDYPDLKTPVLWDNATFIKDAIAGVRYAALYGAALAVVVLLVFLRNIRSTLIIACTIPVSVVATFALIYFGGFSLNIVSFGGLALGIGLLVDNSIVVLENIFRHRESGETSRAAALHGTREVSTAIIASTLTTVVVFLPILFLSGSASILFSQLAYVVAFSLLCSLIIALTLIPLLCRFALRDEANVRGGRAGFLGALFGLSEAAFNWLDERYRGLLHFSLRRRAWVVLGSFALFAAVLPLFRLLGFEYMPSGDEGELRVYGEMAPATRLEALDEVFTQMEATLQREFGDEFENVHTSFGMGPWYRRENANTGRISIKLKPVGEREHSSAELALLSRELLGELPGVSIRTRASGGVYLFRILQSEDESIAIDIRGHDREEAMRLAKAVQKELNAVEGISDARVSIPSGRAEIGLQIDRVKAAEAGLSVESIARSIRTNYGGEIATLYREDGDEYNVRVRLREEDRLALNNLRSLWLVTPAGERVAVSNFVRTRRTTGPTQLDRKNQERSITVAANLDENYSLGNVMRVVEKRLQAIQMPKGFTLVYGGEYEEQQESYRQLAMGLGLAILLVYMVMAAQFESLAHPLIIMFSIPFAGIGVFLSLYFTGTTINIQSILGIVMLAGIVVNNAIVLVDYINLLRREKGMSLREAVEVGGSRRLRPILMTTLTTALALTPMAIGYGSGSELQAPMARVVIGGLLTSTLITLLFVPTLYTMVEEALQEFREKRKTSAERHTQIAASQ